jgi:hypothetical protein
VNRSAINVGSKSEARGSTFKAERKPLERRTALAAVSARRLAEAEARGGRPRPALKQTGRRRRTPTEAEIATAWHELVCRSRPCVKDGCDRPAGPFGHHALRKEWLRRIGLSAHVWDLEDGVAVCEVCHERHETGFAPITRGELIAAGYWQTLVGWARMLDARYFPGREPVLARLEHDYPNQRS